MNQTQIEFVQALDRLRQVRLEALFPDVTNGEGHLLGNIGFLSKEKPAGPIRVADLVQAAPVPAPAVSRNLKGLEAKQLIVREADPKDRRNTLVRLTPLGREKVAEHEEILDRYFAGVEESFSTARYQKLVTEINELADVFAAELKRQIKGEEDSE
ncbi:MAG: winged helix DNA-binding protein [Eubacterium sp.]|nr:winged helix DNA-binding protein [Eubacterium sp.]